MIGRYPIGYAPKLNGVVRGVVHLAARGRTRIRNSVSDWRAVDCTTEIDLAQKVDSESNKNNGHPEVPVVLFVFVREANAYPSRRHRNSRDRGLRRARLRIRRDLRRLHPRCGVGPLWDGPH